MCRIWWFSVEDVGGVVIFRSFSNVDDFRPEVDSGVVSCVVVGQTGMKVLVKFGDSRSNRSRDIRLPHFVMNDAGVRRSSLTGKLKNGKRSTICVSLELIGTHWRAIEWAHPRPKLPHNPTNRVFAKFLFSNFRLTSCEVMQWTIVQLSRKPQMNERRSSTICAVVERPDHHQCGDNLVWLLTQILIPLTRRFADYVHSTLEFTLTWLTAKWLLEGWRSQKSSVSCKPWLLHKIGP